MSIFLVMTASHAVSAAFLNEANAQAFAAKFSGHYVMAQYVGDA